MILRAIEKIRRLLAGYLPGGSCKCVVCERSVWRFMPYRSGPRGTPLLMGALAMIGSNREQFACPRCNSHDRERHLFLYMRASRLCEEFREKAILHFAPEKNLPTLLSSCHPSRYVRADLYPSNTDIQRVDMTSMAFDRGSFDVVIANHVLEHVPDADRALREIFRVLRPGGIAILQTPYSDKLLRTWEDAGIDTDEARLQAYGQEDHMRLFGKDIFDRIASAGFNNHLSQHADLLPDVDTKKSGVNPQEPFFLFRKPV